MKKSIFKKFSPLLLLAVTSPLFAHIPVLAPETGDLSLHSYYISNSKLSRAVYSDLESEKDFDFYTFNLSEASEGTLQVLVPKCIAGVEESKFDIPYYEAFQPTALLMAGEIRIKDINETKEQYVSFLKKNAVVVASSTFKVGQRPSSTDPDARQTWWLGGKVDGAKLGAGLYTVVVFDETGMPGNYVIGLQKEEGFTPTIIDFIKSNQNTISNGFCSPKGFSEKINLPTAQSQENTGL